jgi:RNA polymerase sigma-70 factor (ECF subfamily)
MNDEFQDRRLVKRLLAGEEPAFSEFFDGYFARLYRFALIRLSDDPDAAKDVAHAAMSKALRRLSTYRGEAALFTWLCTICRNEMSDYLSRLSRDREHVVLAEDFPEIRAAVESLEAPPSDDPETSFRRLEVSRMIQVALDRLPPRYGNALEWKYVYGFSVEEIAQRMDLGLEATHSILARAKRAFRDVYQSLTQTLVVEDEAIKS